MSEGESEETKYLWKSAPWADKIRIAQAELKT